MNCQFSLLLGTFTFKRIFTVRYIDTHLPDEHLHWRKRAVRRPPISTYYNGSWRRSSFKREVEVCPKTPQAYKHGASLENGKYK